MSLLYGVSQVMHRIKLKLYPNHLPNGANTFLARTDSEAALTIEQVCAAMRDQFSGSSTPLQNIHTITSPFMFEEM